MTKEPVTIMFLGYSGSGKGTQVQFLKDYLGEERTLHIYTGARFRKLVAESTSYAAETLKNKILDAGGLAPRFFAVWAWADQVIEKLRPDSHLIFDGSPRAAIEAQILEEAMMFFGRKNPILLVLEIPPDEAVKRLLLRGRHDDNEEAIRGRLAFFEREGTSIIEYLERKDSTVKVAHINGVGTPEEVFARIEAVLP